MQKVVFKKELREDEGENKQKCQQESETTRRDILSLPSFNR